MNKKSFAIELPEQTVRDIKAHYKIRTDGQVRRVLQKLVDDWALPSIIVREVIKPMEKHSG